jgi:hypothetical protein
VTSETNPMRQEFDAKGYAVYRDAQDLRMFVISGDKIGHPGHILLAYEGGGVLFWQGEAMSPFLLIGAGFPASVAVALSSTLQAAFMGPV